MNIPQDPVILLSFINTKLRDSYPSLEELCQSLMVDRLQLEQKIASVGYHYDMAQNRFIPTED